MRISVSLCSGEVVKWRWKSESYTADERRDGSLRGSMRSEVQAGQGLRKVPGMESNDGL
jgi:hypothetical protein